MGIEYYLGHTETKTFIQLGKKLSSGPRFEGFGDEATAFLATRPYGTFVLHNDHGWLPWWDNDGLGKRSVGRDDTWSEVTRDELINSSPQTPSAPASP